MEARYEPDQFFKTDRCPYGAVFLEMLKSAGNKAGKASNGNEAEDIDFDEMYRHIRDNLKRIDSQEISITGILNEDYDDWYDDSGGEFYYEDNSGISDMLGEACGFVHICMDMERYKEGFAVGNQMLAMEILCDNAYGDEEFSLGDMAYHGLLNCDLKQVVLDTVYGIHRNKSDEDDTEEIYDAQQGSVENGGVCYCSGWETVFTGKVLVCRI